MERVDLSIIIVNWNSKEYLRKCLESVFAQTSGIHFEIIVIDSASFDGCDQMLSEQYPSVRYIQSKENVGFAKANNMAYKAAKGNCVLFLNPDTELRGPAISVLHHALTRLPNAGIVGAKLLTTTGAIDPHSIAAFPGLANQFFDLELLQRRFPRLALWGIKPLYEDHREPTEVDVISGACLMMRKDAFEKVGMFSEQYFMYSEDVDLCFKSGKANYKTFYVPNAVVVHHGGGSSTKAKVNCFTSVMMLESRWRFYRMTKPIWYSCLYRIGMLVMSVLRIGFAVALLPIGALSNDCSRWRGAVVKWYRRLRWTLGFENWVKRY